MAATGTESQRERAWFESERAGSRKSLNLVEWTLALRLSRSATF